MKEEEKKEEMKERKEGSRERTKEKNRRKERKTRRTEREKRRREKEEKARTNVAELVTQDLHLDVTRFLHELFNKDGAVPKGGLCLRGGTRKGLFHVLGRTWNTQGDYSRARTGEKEEEAEKEGPTQITTAHKD